ncbi:MAG TPA: HAMP domain-containing sensor histidine kinase [Ottowia sp.]|uniref:sensor histidine kinase n=1 Tax=Ottowia sp. TaxID=1898956 RepID=UPI002BE7F94F|nr:HAMP domain-containing sensor histidine kinase [Ottowia sp.]HMN21655.1 HAMP domain-containing sensor histidine kinase [Ottowia sp.]
MAELVHDLRQPIEALAIYAELLMLEPGRAAELAPRMLRAVHSARALLAAPWPAAPGAGIERVTLQPVPVHELLAELHEQYRAQAQRRGLALRLRAPVWMLDSDALLLRRILGNLLANAIRHTRHGGVLLAARPRGAGLALEVWDTGEGIDASQLARVFEPGVQLDRPGRAGMGGLGLAIAQRLSDSLGYRIEVRSQLGRGSVFRVLTDSSAGHACARSAGPGSGS